MTTAHTDGLLAPCPAWPWAALPVDDVKLAAYLSACETRRIAYGLGRKADEAGRALAAFPPRYGAIDCSGWVRAALAYAADIVLPDGSVCQHEWCAGQGLKVSDFPALLRQDGALRIAFIVPNRQHPIGHVYLCRNGRTMESWGGHGPGSRSPLAHVLHALTTHVYVARGPTSLLRSSLPSQGSSRNGRTGGALP